MLTAVVEEDPDAGGSADAGRTVQGRVSHSVLAARQAGNGGVREDEQHLEHAEARLAGRMVQHRVVVEAPGPRVHPLHAPDASAACPYPQPTAPQRALPRLLVL